MSAIVRTTVQWCRKHTAHPLDADSSNSWTVLAFCWVFSSLSKMQVYVGSWRKPTLGSSVTKASGIVEGISANSQVRIATVVGLG